MCSRHLAAVALVVAATLPAGCGSARGGPETAGSGRALFARSCAGCHSLSGIDDPRRQGGDLLNFHASRAQLLQLAGEMPVRPPLREAQLRAVVGYVTAVEQGRRR